MERLTSLLGLFAMLGLAWLLSSNRRRVPVRVIVGGLLLQFTFAALIFYTPPGRALFEVLKQVFVNVIGCVDQGTKFVFGKEVVTKGSLLNNFAFYILPTLIFFSALMSLLYHFGVMQWVIKGLAWVMQKTLGTSGSETLATAANVFVGQTEAPLVVRPYLDSMTRSELMTLMVGGFATVAGGVLATYVLAFGVDAGHLLTASVISAPAALVVAKLMQPEVEESKTLGTVQIEVEQEAVNAIHAAANGAADGVKLAINVGAMIIAFLALIALANLGIGWVGSWFQAEGAAPWTLQAGLGYVFAPMAWLMGVESSDCLHVGQLLGIKIVGNEFIAYDQLNAWRPEGKLSPRSEMLATYALCGFANFGSIGIQLGGIGPLAPKRRADLARLGFRAMLGGTLAACMTACVVGLLVES